MYVCVFVTYSKTHFASLHTLYIQFWGSGLYFRLNVRSFQHLSYPQKESHWSAIDAPLARNFVCLCPFSTRFAAETPFLCPKAEGPKAPKQNTKKKGGLWQKHVSFVGSVTHRLPLRVLTATKLIFVCMKASLYPSGFNYDTLLWRY